MNPGRAGPQSGGRRDHPRPAPLRPTIPRLLVQLPPRLRTREYTQRRPHETADNEHGKAHSDQIRAPRPSQTETGDAVGKASVHMNEKKHNPTLPAAAASRTRMRTSDVSPKRPRNEGGGTADGGHASITTPPIAARRYQREPHPTLPCLALLYLLASNTRTSKKYELVFASPEASMNTLCNDLRVKAWKL